MENENAAEWQTPPPPEKIVDDPPQMSEIGTIFNIFLEPGRTFEDLKRKPRFIAGSILIAVLAGAFTFALFAKVGEAGLRSSISQQLEKNPQVASMSSQQKSDMVDMQVKIQGYTRYAVPVFVFIFLAIGGLLYFLGSKAFGGTGGYLHALSVWVYSSIPPTVVGMIANFIVLALKSSDEIDLASSQRGVVHANLGILIDGKAMPVVATLLGTIDLFMIWGWVLAAIGLRITNRMSKGSAWSVVIIIALIGIVARVVGAAFSGNPS